MNLKQILNENKSGETSYTGKFKKSGESREFILHSKDRIVKESVNEGKLQFKNLKKGDILVGKFPPYKEMEVVSLTDKSAKVKSSRGGVVDIYSTNNYELKENNMKLSKFLNEKSSPKFKVGQVVNYIPKLSGLSPKKKLKINKVRFEKGDTLTKPGWYYSFDGINLGSHENDIKLVETIKENTEPQIITQLRDVMKSGYKTLKDPKSGRKMKVDSYSASAIVKVYDVLKDPKNKEKFSSMGLLGMQSTAFKLIK